MSVGSVGAQGRGGVATAGDVVRQVRTALAHGDVAGARRLADAAANDAPRQALSLALVDIFEGKYAEARTRLLPVAAAAPLGDAALELGLLEIKMGRRAEGRRRLDPMLDVRTFAGPDDYFRLAARRPREPRVHARQRRLPADRESAARRTSRPSAGDLLPRAAPERRRGHELQQGARGRRSLGAGARRRRASLRGSAARRVTQGPGGRDRGRTGLA